jgi:hypothetical protein
MTASRVLLILIAAALSGCGANPRPFDLSDDERAAVSLVSSAHSDEQGSGREGMLRLNPHWPIDVQGAVTAGEVKIGMTRDQVLAAWGFPSSRWQNSFVTIGHSETWRYRNVNPPMDVSFMGDTVDSVGYHATGAVPKEPKGQWGYQLRSAAALGSE